MRLVAINGGMYREIIDKDITKDIFLAVCMICENKETCDDCVMFNIEFKRNKIQFICEHCLCDPLEHASKSTIIECAKKKYDYKGIFKIIGTYK